MNETLVKIMFKNLGIDADVMKAQAVQGFATIKEAAARMERIDVMLTAICVKLDIPLPPQLPAQEPSHADQQALIDGNKNAS